MSFSCLGRQSSRLLGCWLCSTSGLVTGIVVLGGYTRLSESGLSMVDWKLVHFSPPSTDPEWQEYFDKYKQSPEFILKNSQYTVDDFKRIYWIEHLHRVYGRLLGLWIIVPTAWLLAFPKHADKFTRRNCILLSGLVLCQGLLGWYMVKSGLNPDIVTGKGEARVSQYRLAAHFSCALAIMTISLHSGCRLLMSAPRIPLGITPINSVLAMIAGTAVAGSFVAGLDAGIIYNTFPKMGLTWFPVDGWIAGLGWRNFTENPSLVQFVHRALALSTTVATSLYWGKYRLIFKSDRLCDRLLHALLGICGLQVGVGILTLLTVVPVPLGVLHQATALALVGIGTMLRARLRMTPITASRITKADGKEGIDSLYSRGREIMTKGR